MEERGVEGVDQGELVESVGAAVGEDQGAPFLGLRVRGCADGLGGEEGWEIVFAGEGEGGGGGVEGERERCC